MIPGIVLEWQLCFISCKEENTSEVAVEILLSEVFLRTVFLPANKKWIPCIIINFFCGVVDRTRGLSFYFIYSTRVAKIGLCASFR